VKETTQHGPPGEASRNRGARQKTGHSDAPEVRDAHQIAEELKPDLPENVAERVAFLRARTEEHGGPGVQALEAVLEIVRARVAGWLWRPRGAVQAVPVAEDDEGILVPAWAVDTIAAIWLQYSRRKSFLTLEVGFGVDIAYRDPKKKKTVRHFAVRRQNYLKEAGRALAMQELRSRTGLNTGEAAKEVAEAEGLHSDRPIADAHRKHKGALAPYFPEPPKSGRPTRG
jgi:hypothetical protein